MSWAISVPLDKKSCSPYIAIPSPIYTTGEAPELYKGSYGYKRLRTPNNLGGCTSKKKSQKNAFPGDQGDTACKGHLRQKKADIVSVALPSRGRTALALLPTERRAFQQFSLPATRLHQHITRPIDSTGIPSNGFRARPAARREGRAAAIASQGCSSGWGSRRRGSIAGKNPADNTAAAAGGAKNRGQNRQHDPDIWGINNDVGAASYQSIEWPRQ